MGSGAFRLTVLTRFGLLARIVAIFCIVSLVAVEFAHSNAHFAPLSNAVTQADAGPPGDASDSSNNSAVPAEHCHGCSMFLMTVQAPSVAVLEISTAAPMRRANRQLPYVPATNTPPPRA
jgi:hypothetical protein